MFCLSSNLNIVYRWLPVLVTTLFIGETVRSQDVADISFIRDVAPILTKAGCNSGACHAKAGGGQNGFELSLLGFEPLEDYEHIVREGRGRRVSLASPERSLLLAKATGRVPHGGGVRMSVDSDNYRLLQRWIFDGAAIGREDTPDLVALDVEPANELMQSGSHRSLRAVARYRDDSTRDVTSLALYESNDHAMVQVNDHGEVTAGDIPGKAAVMVRYQGKVAVFNAAIPLGQPVTEVHEPNNFIDVHVFSNLRELGIPPSPLCDDATFLRRVSLDIAGRLPTEVEVREFFSHASDMRRGKAIDWYLASSSYADYFANKWTSLLKNRRDEQSDITANFAFHAWIRDSLLENRPYDQLVRELLAATGTVIGNPAVAWYKRVKEPKQQVEDVAQLFLGVRMQCAQCHHHPFERWSQDDYYGLVAFFSQVGRKPTAVPGEDLIFHKRGVATAQNIRSGQSVRPVALGDDVGVIAPDQDPRLPLADWMSQADNPYFAKAVVNRYWKHFLKRGLIEPEDDIRDTNPPSNPELLAALERHFVDSGFDLKELVRVIVNSRTYQLSSEPNDHNLMDRQNYSRFYPRRLSAEVLLDSIDQFAGTHTEFADLPIGTTAVGLPDNSYNKASPFLRVFGRPNAQSVCECERVESANLAQSLHLLNAPDISAKVGSTHGFAERLATDSQTTPVEKVRRLYEAAFARAPTTDELETSIGYLMDSRSDASGNPLDAVASLRTNLQDLMWAMINGKEFLFNH